MKKFALLVLGVALSFSVASAQDTLIFEDFNDTLIGGINDAYIEDFPPGILNDTTWYNYDEDGNSDASGGGFPEGMFVFTGGFAPVDTLDPCMGANSWTTPNTAVSNWLFLPAITITNGSTAWLKWKSAPTQTPYYLDGYEIRISTTINDHQTAFTDTVFTAAEYTGGAATGGNDYSNYTFSPGWVHGMDGLWTECSTCLVATDSARQNGIQRPDSVSLAAYDNMTIYIAFHHNSTDDFLISWDDILVTEDTDITFGIEDANDFYGQVYPNPATDFVNVKFDAVTYHNARVEMINSNGQMVYTAPLMDANSRIQLTNFSGGVYYVKIIADEGSMVEKLIVNK
jgi:hypothetical protein